ncbi:MAG: BamA/TamA family outer membrane protein [Bacteroidales bacterium]|nr:BamA/TamA family outer membrane protein [Bacteroidales bacterium]
MLTRFHKHINFRISLWLLGLLVVFFTSCSPTRRISSEEELYNKAKVNVDDRKFETASLQKYERITPNKKVVGVRFHLFLYNLANPDKESFPHSWLRKIGEPPVIYDSVLAERNKSNYEKYLADIGYNDVKVEKEVKVKKHNKVNVLYDVKLGQPTLIGKYSYHFEDTSIQKYIFDDTVSALIKEGSFFNKELMQLERMRIETILKNNGYYRFSKEYIYFEVSPTSDSYVVDVTLNIKQNISGYIDPVSKVRKHRQYYINNILIIPDVLIEGKTYTDTNYYNGFKLLQTGGVGISPSTLVSFSRILPGDLYQQKKVNNTYASLSSLGLFRFININFIETASSEAHDNLDCRIELAMRDRQSYSTELVATYSGGDPGARGSITYSNFNFFKGGELFKVGLTGAYESLKNRLEGFEPMREFGLNSRLETPKFLLPLARPDFQRKYNPRTVIQFTYNYQKQAYYVRTIANTSFGYSWKGNIYNKHEIYPVDFYLVKLPEEVDLIYFDKYIKNTRLENSFENHTILGLRYRFEYSNQNQRHAKDHMYFHSNIESAGLLIKSFEHWTKWGSDSMLFGVKYAQYIRSDFDFRQFKILNPQNKIAYRLYAGFGIPYGNSVGLPFEKMFWSGGPYGIRAWNERSLGPGSYPDSTYNHLGDIKLEGNIEYRFKMFWIIEGALFIDAGNVWLQNEEITKPGANFEFATFYKDIAVGVGYGLRFDLSFIVLRTDFGFKLRDPAIQPNTNLPFEGDEPHYYTGSKWTFRKPYHPNPDLKYKRLEFQIGIGYPF